MKPMFKLVTPGLFLAALFVFSVAHAKAVTEFCPASLAIKPVGVASEGRPATLYGIMLKAPGARDLIATLTFDTDKGWFSTTTPAVALVEKQYHYGTAYWTATRSDWNSPLMYVKFSSPVHVTNAWVSIGNAQACLPSPVHAKPVNEPNSQTLILPRDKLVSKDADQLSTSPLPGSVILTATSTAPVYRSACADPFSEGRVTRPAMFDPGNTAHFNTSSGFSIVEVAIDRDGSVSAWIWLSSGETGVDTALLWSAQHSEYKNAVAYCQPVPSLYLYWLFFS